MEVRQQIRQQGQAMQQQYRNESMLQQANQLQQHQQQLQQFPQNNLQQQNYQQQQQRFHQNGQQQQQFPQNSQQQQQQVNLGSLIDATQVLQWSELIATGKGDFVTRCVSPVPSQPGGNRLIAG